MHAHQDSSYLHTHPKIKILGFWFPIDDATIENGCLWFEPGSHLESPNDQPKVRFLRNPVEGAKPATFYDKTDGSLEAGNFVAVPVKSGACVLIHGLVIHRSGFNKSDFPRRAYTFHVYDKAEVEWAKENWCQPSEALPFPSLYDN